MWSKGRKMWARLKDRYSELSPDRKRQVTIAVVGAGVFAVAIWSYLGSREEPGEGTVAPQGEASTYRLETKILDKKYHEDRAAELKKATQMYGEIMREMRELRSLVEEEGRRAEDLRTKPVTGFRRPPSPQGPSPSRFSPMRKTGCRSRVQQAVPCARVLLQTRRRSGGRRWWVRFRWSRSKTWAAMAKEIKKKTVLRRPSTYLLLSWRHIFFPGSMPLC